MLTLRLLFIAGIVSGTSESGIFINSNTSRTDDPQNNPKGFIPIKKQNYIRKDSFREETELDDSYIDREEPSALQPRTRKKASTLPTLNSNREHFFSSDSSSNEMSYNYNYKSNSFPEFREEYLKPENRYTVEDIPRSPSDPKYAVIRGRNHQPFDRNYKPKRTSESAKYDLDDVLSYQETNNAFYTAPNTPNLSGRGRTEKQPLEMYDSIDRAEQSTEQTDSKEFFSLENYRRETSREGHMEKEKKNFIERIMNNTQDRLTRRNRSTDSTEKEESKKNSTEIEENANGSEYNSRRMPVNTKESPEQDISPETRINRTGKEKEKYADSREGKRYKKKAFGEVNDSGYFYVENTDEIRRADMKELVEEMANGRSSPSSSELSSSNTSGNLSTFGDDATDEIVASCFRDVFICFPNSKCVFKAILKTTTRTSKIGLKIMNVYERNRRKRKACKEEESN